MATADMQAGMCYGHPPATMLLPAQQVPMGIAQPGRGSVAMTLTSVRPSVLHKDAACSLWRPLEH